MDDVLANLVHFTDGGQAVTQAPFEANPYAALITHVFQEMRLRNQQSFAFKLKNFHLDDKKYPKVRRAAEVWRMYQPKSARSMFKFGKSQYLEPTLQRGAHRICPASFYRDDALVSAIKDDELQFSRQTCNAYVEIIDQEGGRRTFPTAGPAKITHTVNTDYYLACYAMALENRLFDDFDADACLVIHDIERYVNRLQEVIEPALPKWTWVPGVVQYHDPYNLLKTPDVYFSKHMRYAYQREIRMIWVPPEPRIHLEPMHFEIGDLSSCCDLIRL